MKNNEIQTYELLTDCIIIQFPQVLRLRIKYSMGLVWPLGCRLPIPTRESECSKIWDSWKELFSGENVSVVIKSDHHRMESNMLTCEQEATRLLTSVSWLLISVPFKRMKPTERYRVEMVVKPKPSLIHRFTTSPLRSVQLVILH